MTFLIWPVVCGWKDWEEHLPTSIAGGVLRLRAISHPLCDRSAWRFAKQDDGFVGGVKSIRLATQKTRKNKKVTGSRDGKGKLLILRESGCW